MQRSRTNNSVRPDGDWGVYHQFQSHEQEFDYLKSLEIEEKISKIRWCPPIGNNLFLFSTNGTDYEHIQLSIFKISTHPISLIR